MNKYLYFNYTFARKMFIFVMPFEYCLLALTNRLDHTKNHFLLINLFRMSSTLTVRPHFSKPHSPTEEDTHPTKMVAPLFADSPQMNPHFCVTRGGRIISSYMLWLYAYFREDPTALLYATPRKGLLFSFILIAQIGRNYGQHRWMSK